MTDRRKIILGNKDVQPKKNEDVFVNIELSRSTDELANEIIDNNFNLLEQFNRERDNSLRFCLYGTLDSISSNIDEVPIKIKTNHGDLLYSPRKNTDSIGLSEVVINSNKLSKNGSLSKNIFNKTKGSYYFLFELDRNNFINNNETKSLIIEINKQEEIFTFEDNAFDSGNVVFHNTSLPSSFPQTTSFKVGDTIVVEQDLFEWNYDDNYFKSGELAFTSSTKHNFRVGQEINVTGQITEPTYNGKVEVRDVVDDYSLSTWKTFTTSTPVEPGKIFGTPRPEYNGTVKITDIYWDTSLGAVIKTDKPFTDSSESISGTLKKVSANGSQDIFYIKEIPFLFYDSEGNKVPYGTDTVDINLNGDLQTIENDYPFLYGVHWIRRDLTPPKLADVSFFVSEENQTNILSVDESAGNVEFVVGLDRPSLFGLEKVDVVIINDETIRNPNEDFVFETTTINWSKGEQYKTVDITLIDDLFVEDTEIITFGFKNLKFAEEGDLNTFNLKILDSDTPIPIGFSSLSQTLVESNTKVAVNIFFENPMNVPSQTVDVVVNNNETTAIIGSDYENTGTANSPEFRKTINFVQGETGATFNVEIYDDFDYEFTKELHLTFDNPSENVEILPAYNNHIINIEDSLVPQYTRYNFNNDELNGYGIFRMAGAVNQDGAKLEWANNGQLYGFTNSFNYDIEIINRGVDIIYNNEIIGAGEPVLTQSLSGGYQEFIIDLPSNSSLDSQNKKYTQSQYEFTIKNIEPLPGQPSGLFDEQEDKKFHNLRIPIQTLDASDSGNTEYYLASRITDIKTRYRPGGGFLSGEEPGCTDNIQSPTNININGTILLNIKVKNSNTFFNLPTKLQDVGFVPNRIDVSECVEGVENVEDGGLTQVSRTLLLPLKTPATDIFNF